MNREITITYKSGEKEEGYPFKDVVIGEAGVEIVYATEKIPPHKGYVEFSEIEEITIK